VRDDQNVAGAQVGRCRGGEQARQVVAGLDLG
jgi:hypothetical protein